MDNPVGLSGFEFIEFATTDPDPLRQLFLAMGLTLTRHHRDKALELYEQNDIHFILNLEPGLRAARFTEAHGPTASAMCWRVSGDPVDAAQAAATRGAQLADGDYPLPALEGIGGTLIYLCNPENLYDALGFVPVATTTPMRNCGFLRVDHLTNNVEKGNLSKWSDFYKGVFGFTEMRYFDIRGNLTGLQSYALKSPCGTFAIPINEAKEKRSQINEYLERHNGPGIQHIALLTEDLVTSIQRMNGQVPTLDIEPDYYDTAFDRTPTFGGDRQALKDLQILIDGDERGYLLQIFSKDAIGPIFFEFIQRANHHSFGEGNFGALFKSIERDQQRRGYL